MVPSRRHSRTSSPRIAVARRNHAELSRGRTSAKLATHRVIHKLPPKKWRSASPGEPQGAVRLQNIPTANCVPRLTGYPSGDCPVWIEGFDGRTRVDRAAMACCAGARQCQGSSSPRCDTGWSLILLSTSVSSPLEPCLRPYAMPRSARWAALFVRQILPSSRNRRKAGQRFSI
jgi:hypothetical protein